MNKFEQIYEHLKIYDQLNVLKYWHVLTKDQQETFYNQIISIDLNEMKTIHFNSKQSKEFIDQIDFNQQDSHKLINECTDQKQLDQFESTGLELIADSQLAVITLAAGMSKRLSISYPKGIYSIDLLSTKSLFQIQAERLIRIKSLASRYTSKKSQSIRIPWYLMTSEHTHDLTVEFFAENNYFGLDKRDLIFFKQKSLPCTNSNGKLVMENKFKIKMAPNGNGNPCFIHFK
jgi:UDP-N-acetylglucosamine/UDP-N-acetylgalactosamine diphosphorylase